MPTSEIRDMGVQFCGVFISNFENFSFPIKVFDARDVVVGSEQLSEESVKVEPFVTTIAEYPLIEISAINICIRLLHNFSNIVQGLRSPEALRRFPESQRVKIENPHGFGKHLAK